MSSYWEGYEDQDDMDYGATDGLETPGGAGEAATLCQKNEIKIARRRPRDFDFLSPIAGGVGGGRGCNPLPRSCPSQPPPVTLANFGVIFDFSPW